jgi:hypothetical protein
VLFIRRRRRRRAHAASEELAAALLAPEDTFDVFLSYRRTDFAICDLVVALLEKEGVRVFNDRLGHMTGQPFDQELAKSIAVSATFCSIITLPGTAQLLRVTAHEVDYTVVEILLALHWRQAGRIRRILPLLVGVETQEPSADGAKRPRRDLLEDNAEWKRMLKALPDVVPLACIDHAAALLRAVAGEELAPSLRRASVKELMCATVASAAAAGDGALAEGLLTFDWMVITGLQQDVKLYVRDLARKLRRQEAAERQEEWH